MAINFLKIKSRLENLKNPQRGNFPQDTRKWKPDPGKQSVRIVPNVKSPDFPFVELYFHYDLAGRTWLSPISFGRPDPVVEYANKLRKSGDETLIARGKALSPKKRNFAPILVRDKESEGVKWWGFGKEVYETLLSIFDEGEFGDITDPVEGYDLTVEHKTKEELGADYPKTFVRPKAKPSQILPDPVDPALLKKISEEQPDILDIWVEPTYDELNDALYKHLNPQEDEPQTEDDPVVDTNVEPPESAVIVNDAEPVPVESKPTPVEEAKQAGPPVSPSAAASNKGKNMNEVFAAFDDIIKKK